MPQLAPVLDSIESVPEPLREFYVERDGKHHLDLSS
ncbi:hypothetical protein LCGC14_2126620, partial [marine sediment metagenome]